MDCNDELDGVSFTLFSSAFKAKASLPLVNEFRYSWKKCLFTDSRALVSVSLNKRFTMVNRATIAGNVTGFF